MCFTLLTKEKTKKAAIAKHMKIAKKDIKVWKIVKSSYKKDYFTSLYREFKYKRGYHYSLSKEMSPYITDNWGCSEKVVLIIDRGFHSYIRKDGNRMHYGIDSIVVAFYIPKGAKYFKDNLNGEYVSDQIVLY